MGDGSHTSSDHALPTPRAVVVTGGAAVPPELAAVIDGAELVVAADGGLDHLHRLGRQPHLLVGDLDSVSSTALAEAQRLEVPVERHPAHKDATDTELALEAAAARGYRSLTLVTGGGDRLDHVLGWLAVLADPRWASCEQVDAWCATTHLQVLHGPRHHRWRETTLDSVVSLLPLAGACTGVTTSGLRWELYDDTLSATSSRGISNAVTQPTVTVSLTSGVLAVVRPHRSVDISFNLSPTHLGGPDAS